MALPPILAVEPCNVMRGAPCRDAGSLNQRPAREGVVVRRTRLRLLASAGMTTHRPILGAPVPRGSVLTLPNPHPQHGASPHSSDRSPARFARRAYSLDAAYSVAAAGSSLRAPTTTLPSPARKR